jgi:DNA-binding response OmpR family regulator
MSEAGSEASKVLVVEDDAHILIGLEEVLISEGFAFQGIANGSEALPAIKAEQPDVVILDVMLPGKSGFDICRDLRKNGNNVPVLMLTAKGQEIDKVLGLELGADDYVTKPFGLRELVARVRALLRRAENGKSGQTANDQQQEPDRRFTIGSSVINPATYTVAGDNEQLDLTPREMELLQAFDAHRGIVLSRERLLNEVWGVNYFGTTRTLDQTVAQVRKKLRLTGTDPNVLTTVHGVGYRLVSEQ